MTACEYTNATHQRGTGNAGTRGPGALNLYYLRIPSFWMTALYRSVSYFFK